MRISAREACVKPHLRTRSDIIVHYDTKFYITRCENADFRTQSVRKTAFYTRSNVKLVKTLQLSF